MFLQILLTIVGIIRPYREVIPTQVTKDTTLPRTSSIRGGILMTTCTAELLPENEASATRDWCRDRAAVYSALAELYGSPLKEKWVGWFISPRFIDLMKSFAFSDNQDNTLFNEGLEELKQAVESQSAAKLSLALQAEYSHLFILGARESIHPYASVYLSQWKRVQGDAWLAARRFLREAGYAVKEDKKIFEDHLSVECEFLAALCKAAVKATKKKTADKLVEILKLQESFLREHMLTWVPKYCEDIVRVSKHPFYSACAKITEGFLRLDAEILKQIIEG
jgi:TorA maturation chaperone TorD